MSDSDMKEEAKASALKKISGMFTRPEHLSRLEAVTKREERKKAAVEAMLRTGVQSQVEGIRTAISKLQLSVDNISTITSSLNLIEEKVDIIPDLKKKMQKLSQANSNHSQYAAAKENLKHIMNINESLIKAQKHLDAGEILHGHKIIMELENSRDDLMYEVYKMKSDGSQYDINLLKNYFVGVDALVNQLGKQLWYICERCLQAVRSEDGACEKLVSALRVVEREERIDKYYVSRQSASYTFMPPGRPRKWRKKLFEVLKDSVADKIEGTQIEDRQGNANWLVRYLELCRKSIVDDLKIVKSGLVICFPPDYNIYDRYILMYHDSICSVLKETAAEELDKAEIVHLLSWFNTYSSEEMLGNPRLDINVDELLAEKPLLSRESTNQLHDRFIELTGTDMNSWLDRIISHEEKDWNANEKIQAETNGCLYTQLPSHLFSIVDDSINVTKKISQELVPRVIAMYIEKSFQFAQKYRDAVINFKIKHFENRELLKNFTSTVIAVANNCDIFCESSDKLEKQIRMTMESSVGMDDDANSVSTRNRLAFGINREELIGKIELLRTKWRGIMNDAISDLQEELLKDIQTFLEEMLTKRWIRDNKDAITICKTIEDYYTDYRCMRPHIRRVLLQEIQYCLFNAILRAIDEKNTNFANYNERNLAAHRLEEDVLHFENMFKKFMNQSGFEFQTFSKVFVSVADIWKLSDKSILFLETSTFVRKYPDITKELVASILQNREDMNATESKQMAEEALSHIKYHPKGDLELTRLFTLSKRGNTVFEKIMTQPFIFRNII
uniref:Exocyst complex component Sec6 n=1 Tax=Rhabditophanes sp. KR3021 TaxID=114890 RepID=A0AC35UD11_9BILA